MLALQVTDLYYFTYSQSYSRYDRLLTEKLFTMVTVHGRSSYNDLMGRNAGVGVALTNKSIPGSRTPLHA